jgi:predicted glycoside hydrolase/deacetylase ChbG (UPF0249 family)
VGAGGRGARLHADDVGLSDGVNAMVEVLLAGARLAGVSVVANGPATPSAAEIVRRHPEVPVHLHLNLTEGRPLSDPVRLGALVGADGAFVGLRRLVWVLVMGRVAPAAIEAELEAQLAHLAALGVRVAAIDSHHHVHALAPVGAVVALVAARRDLGLARSYERARTHTLAGAARKVTLSIVARSTQLAMTGRATLPAGWGPPGDERGGDRRGDEHRGDFAMASWERLRRHRSRHGLTIVCHPGGTCDRGVALELDVSPLTAPRGPRS